MARARSRARWSIECQKAKKYSTKRSPGNIGRSAKRSAGLGRCSNPKKNTPEKGSTRGMTMLCRKCYKILKYLDLLFYPLDLCCECRKKNEKKAKVFLTYADIRFNIQEDQTKKGRHELQEKTYNIVEWTEKGGACSIEELPTEDRCKRLFREITEPGSLDCYYADLVKMGGSLRMEDSSGNEIHND